MSAWANRKAAVKAEAESLAKAEQGAILAEKHAELAEKPEAEVLAELELPNPDDMQAGDDFSAFMKATVPSALRNRALRRLWTSDPVLANVDMLVDYGEDFTGKNDVLRVVKTIYRVGKGMLPDKEDLSEDAPDPDAVVKAVKQDTPSSEENADVLAEDRTPQTDDAAIPDAPTLAQGPEDTPVAVAPRRRMRFDFAAGSGPVATETEMT